MAEDNPTAKLFRNIDYFTRQLSFALSQETGNHYISPFAIHAMLAMLYETAEGDTRRDLQKVVYSQCEVQLTAYRDVFHDYLDTSTFQYFAYSKLYIHQRYPLLPEFTLLCREDYCTEFEQMSFVNNLHAAQQINGWLQGVSGNKFRDIITPRDLDANTRMILLNASYFKADFQYTFSVDATHSAEFKLLNDEVIECQMMCMEDVLQYTKNKELTSKLLKLDFTNTDYSMLFIVPNEGVPLENVERQLRYVSFIELVETLRPTRVSVKLPKFKVEYRIDLTDILKQFGMRISYRTTAKFHKINTEHTKGDAIRISNIIQKCSIGINEVGADTAGVGGSSSPRVNLPPQGTTGQLQSFVADQPFLFAMLLHTQGFYCPLTFGKVYTPGV